MSNVSSNSSSKAVRRDPVVTRRVDTSKSAPDDRGTAGPFDLSEVPAIRPYIDFGGLKIAPREGQQLRLDIDERTKRVVAIMVDYQGSLLRVQAFAAPKSTGLWHQARAEAMQQLTKQQARTQEEQGEIGTELVVTTAVPAAQGGGSRTIRLIGVDGPRWMLRGVVMGAAAENAQARSTIIQIFRDIVVVRGDQPMPPSELLALHVPVGATKSSDFAESAPSEETRE